MQQPSEKFHAAECANRFWLCQGVGSNLPPDRCKFLSTPNPLKLKILLSVAGLGQIAVS